MNKTIKAGSHLDNSQARAWNDGIDYILDLLSQDFPEDPYDAEGIRFAIQDWIKKIKERRDYD